MPSDFSAGQLSVLFVILVLLAIYLLFGDDGGGV